MVRMVVGSTASNHVGYAEVPRMVSGFLVLLAKIGLPSDSNEFLSEEFNLLITEPKALTRNQTIPRSQAKTFQMGS